MQIKAMRKFFHPSNWPKEQMVSDPEERAVNGHSHLLCRAIGQCLLQRPPCLPESRAAPADRERVQRRAWRLQGVRTSLRSSLLHEDPFELKAVKTTGSERTKAKHSLT